MLSRYRALPLPPKADPGHVSPEAGFTIRHLPPWPAADDVLTSLLDLCHSFDYEGDTAVALTAFRTKRVQPLAAPAEE